MLVREVGGGDDRTGVGGVGVRTDVRIAGTTGATWDDGGGVMEDVGGTGDENLERSVFCEALRVERVSCDSGRVCAVG